MICSTERLQIRQFNNDDAQFIIKLLNQPSFINNIADKGVRTLDDAVDYIQNGPVTSFREFGFGLGMVELTDSGEPIGMCGLLKRPQLEHPDIGYALLDQYAGRGYALEAARAIVELGHRDHHLMKIVAVTSPNNHGSIRLLEKLGFEFEKMIELYEMETSFFVKVNNLRLN